MIAFFADNHFNARPGYYIHQRLDTSLPIEFHEDDLSALPHLLSSPDCRLLILNWISDTGDNPHPGTEIEQPLKAYLASGRPLLLLHGSSAAFAQWAWWREMVGLRWVRPNDPDGFPPSTHPVRPYSINITKTRHPLAAQLKAFELPTDEIYIHLEQTCPVSVLMETTTDEGTFPQAYLAKNQWDGTIASFIPGHKAASFDCPQLIDNIQLLIAYLLSETK
jgi:type 1 glutamine amidotransferase